MSSVTQRKKTSGGPSEKEAKPQTKQQQQQPVVNDEPKSDSEKPEKVKAQQKAKAATEYYYHIGLLVVTALAFATRVYSIQDPAQVVFDEVHFGKFASHYLQRTYFFDVHPPLGKMLLAATGYWIGYDGHFLFDNIGDDYATNNVPHIGLRLFPAICGSLIVPVAYLTLKEMGLTVLGCLFGALLLVFDNSLMTQSRLILLDSMLMLFGVLSIYTWVKFYKYRYEEFSIRWWIWLTLTGVSLALTLGVKMVGLFSIGTVGIAVLFDLWRLLDYRRGVSLSRFSQHFAARALCLIILPITLYLSFFYIHFAILTHSGPGDAFMSHKFQAELIGNSMNQARTIPLVFNSTVRFRHRNTNVFLHSHAENYPLRYEDERVSSQGQQVTGYSHEDVNDDWIIEPIDPALLEGAHTYHWNGEELRKGYRYVKNSDLVRLKHAGTNSYLLTHDVASSLMSTHMEMTTISDPLERYDETVWRIEVIDADAGSYKIRAKRNTIRIVSHTHNVAVHSHKGTLPDWGFSQQEINGNKNLKEVANNWYIDSVSHSAFVDGFEPEEETVHEAPPKLSFLQKFLELQQLMIQHNAGLTTPHPYSSTPITWPFVLRGISFWETKEGLKQIYLLGNPLIWWLAIVCTFLYMMLWIIDQILLRRGIDDYGAHVRRWWGNTAGYLLLAWLLHYLPFFLMGRCLFLHHYLPSFIFSVMLTAVMFDFIGRVVSEEAANRRTDYRTPMSKWMKKQAGVIYTITTVVTLAICIGSFFFFAPLTYGTGFPDQATLRTRKWFDSWDLQHA
ncbi:Dolichyl-phosphate-mannose-protein mannosyltransferase-domain-containing protein [Polychytrium aggregatum]|uniref:Dolichyl-phosphate-mannose-protein mannosyltransferase-domain-containing protein n=1 Tax=Polychytrium aggregatum TaxID=110093 RepID=UPI0022FE3FB0|nr:Dolichyl-phosphate-mannose-protein mannosyltransferase-domain-containing protein [Polychytrium aggregatum]KAI9208354.1 Dolichyl-phosphate-mannose-protein mannosyltransferase-domain-containing protein [Polychytrium aggregatum]